jgi:pimeloyl-ACP methyl ester carboxylesterase
MTVRRAFVDGPFGQIHLRLTPRAPGPPLVALHATAYSSQSFLPLMAAFGERRQVIAPDAPGYGDSDRPAEAPDLAGYAAAVAAAIAAVTAGPVDLLGYHTGACIAVELAIQQPALARRLVLMGVPYFKALGVAEWRARLDRRHALGESLDQFAERWDYFVTGRAAGVTLARAFQNFADELKAWPDGWRAHAAMFDWDADERLPLVRQPVLVLNPDGHLAEASRAAARLLPDATVCELPGLKGPVLETAAPEIAAAMGEWLEAGTLDNQARHRRFRGDSG